MRLSREKTIRLSHVITDLLVSNNEVEFVEDRDTIRQKTVQILQELLKEEDAVDAEVRLYETLFSCEDPNVVLEGQDFTVALTDQSDNANIRRAVSGHGKAVSTGQLLYRWHRWSDPACKAERACAEIRQKCCPSV